MDQKYTLENIEELFNFIENKQYRNLKDAIVDWNEADIAELIEKVAEEYGNEKAVLLFRLLSKDVASDVFAFLPTYVQADIVNVMSDVEVKNILEDLYVDDAVDLIEELPANVVKRVLKNATSQTRATINQFLKYPENSAGSIMTNEYLAIKKTLTVQETFDYIRSNGQDMETIYTLFVTDKQRHLEGIVTVKDLLMNPYETVVEDIMDPNVICAVTTDDQEDVADQFGKYGLVTMPVVDSENRMVGIVTVDDVVDVMEDEATEDIEKMAAILPTEKPYLKTSVFNTWKSRIPWLLLLMISATFTGQIITSFEDALATCVVLTAFIPMLMDTGGNSGSQASVTIIRALSLGDIEFKDIFKVIWKEFRVSIICAITLASLNFGKIMLIDRLLFNNTDITVLIAFVVCLAMVFTIMVAKFVGCTLPMLAQKIGLDPAVMASPFITTIVDAISLLIYFGIAKWLLSI